MGDNPRSGAEQIREPRRTSFSGVRIGAAGPGRVEPVPGGEKTPPISYPSTTPREELPDRPQEPSDQSRQMGADTVDQPQGAGESAGRPRKDLITAQERSLKDAVVKIRAGSEQLREAFEAPDSRITDAHRDKLRSFIEDVDFLCSYLDDKLSTLVNVETKQDDRLHIAVIVSVHLEDAAGSSSKLKDALHVDDATAEEAEDEAEGKRTAFSLLGFLQQLLKQLGKKFGKLVAGLLVPKEWTAKGEYDTVVIFGKAGVGVEIKFGR